MTLGILLEHVKTNVMTGWSLLKFLFKVRSFLYLPVLPKFWKKREWTVTKYILNLEEFNKCKSYSDVVTLL